MPSFSTEATAGREEVKEMASFATIFFPYLILNRTLFPRRTVFFFSLGAFFSVTLTVFEDYDTALGINVLINHVGDCFD